MELWSDEADRQADLMDAGGRGRQAHGQAGMEADDGARGLRGRQPKGGTSGNTGRHTDRVRDRLPTIWLNKLTDQAI